MRILARGLLILGLLIGSGIGAVAGDITWTLNNVQFSDGNTATGFFITNGAVNTIEGFSIQVTGPDGGADFVATQMLNAYLPGTIGAANSDFSKFLDLVLAQNMTGAGGVINIASGFDCPGCGTLLVNSDHDPTVDGAPVSEPSALIVLGSGLGLLGTMLRRKLIRI
ncbi:MAG: PEP-CTERM sorting domain-containing protein [Candidatus Korobacteraceae bacterium]